MLSLLIFFLIIHLYHSIVHSYFFFLDLLVVFSLYFFLHTSYSIAYKYFNIYTMGYYSIIQSIPTYTCLIPQIIFIPNSSCFICSSYLFIHCNLLFTYFKEVFIPSFYSYSIEVFIKHYYHNHLLSHYQFYSIFFHSNE